MKHLKTKALILCLLLVPVLIFPMVLKAEEKVTLHFWIHQHPPEIQFIQEALFPEFKKTHPNVDIEFSYFPNKDYSQKIMVAMATGTAPDFFDLGDWFYPTFVNKGLIAPVASARPPPGLSVAGAFRGDFATPGFIALRRFNWLPRVRTPTSRARR